MKLQKRQTRKYEGKDYFKWVVTIPPDEIEELGWKEGMELKQKREGKKLVIEPD